MKSLIVAGLLAIAALSSSAAAQEPVVATQNADQLFTKPDPQLNANKQVVYRIMRDLLDAGQWDKASELLSDEYIQHNPNAKSGRDAVVYYFAQVLKVQPRPIPENWI